MVATAVTAIVVILAIVWMRLYLQRRVRIGRNRGPRRVIDEFKPYEIGGLKQWVQIRSTDERNPVLLYLHGGPGMPMTPFAHVFQTPWEEHFTVVQWDQRDSGKTLMTNKSPIKELTLEHHVEDGLELVALLRARFPERKIVVLGHSWGTMLSVAMIQERPEWFDAYIAIGQVADFANAERYGYECVLAEAERRGDERATRALRQYPDYPSASDNILAAHNAVRQQQVRLGFCHHNNPNVMLLLLKLGFASPDYGWNDLRSFILPGPRNDTQQMAMNLMPTFDPRNFGASFRCPVYMVGGEFDLFTPTPMAKAYFDAIVAPHKEFVHLPDAAHFGPLEAPQVIFDLLVDRVKPALHIGDTP